MEDGNEDTDGNVADDEGDWFDEEYEYRVVGGKRKRFITVRDARLKGISQKLTCRRSNLDKFSVAHPECIVVAVLGSGASSNLKFILGGPGLDLNLPGCDVAKVQQRRDDLTTTLRAAVLPTLLTKPPAIQVCHISRH